MNEIILTAKEIAELVDKNKKDIVVSLLSAVEDDNITLVRLIADCLQDHYNDMKKLTKKDKEIRTLCNRLYDQVMIYYERLD